MNNEELLDKMTDAFLRWPLPDSVCADLCATRHGDKHRVGTNLLSHTEAKAMFLDVVLPLIAQLASPPKPTQGAEKGEPRIGGHHLCNKGHGWVVNGQPCYLCQHERIELHVAEKTRFLNEREAFRRKLLAATGVLEEVRDLISGSDDFSADDVIERIKNGIAAAQATPPCRAGAGGEDGYGAAGLVGAGQHIRPTHGRKSHKPHRGRHAQ